MSPALRGGRWSGRRGGRDVAQRWLAVCGLRRGGVVPQWARAALTLSTSNTNGETNKDAVDDRQAAVSETGCLTRFSSKLTCWSKASFH